MKKLIDDLETKKTELPNGELINRIDFNLSTNSKIFGLFDLHIPFHSKSSIEIAIKEGLKYNPDYIVLGGDVMDFYSISNYMKKPDKTILKKEVDVGVKFLKYLRNKFPKIPIIYRTGNHDSRLQKFIYNVPALFKIIELDELLHLDENKITLVDDMRIITCGKVNILHGDEKKGSGKNIARVMSNKFPEQNIIYGHYHRPDEYVVTDEFNNYWWSVSVGCLSELSPAFCPYNDWRHGFIMINVDKKGDFEFENKRIINGKVYNRK